MTDEDKILRFAEVQKIDDGFHDVSWVFPDGSMVYT